VEAAITLKLEDKPYEFIATIKLLLTNDKFLDTNFALALLKHDTKTTKPKLILMEDNAPLKFTHLGQYAFTSRNRIFEKEENWKGDNPKQPYQDQESRDDSLSNPVVYFTIAIATDILPRTLISGIKMKWEMHGGGKLLVKDLQLQESKGVLALYYVYTGTPYSIILKTLQNIMRDATSIRENERMKLTNDKEFNPPPQPWNLSACTGPMTEGDQLISL
jgi:hypothetical protein